MPQKRDFCHPKTLSQRFDVFYQSRYCVVIGPRPFAVTTTPLVEINHKCMPSQAGSDGLLKTVAIVSRTPVQVDQRRVFAPFLARDFVPKPHPIQNDVMFPRVESRLTDRFHWEKSRQEHRQAEEFPEHHLYQ